jgi:hypothetical protein
VVVGGAGNVVVDDAVLKRSLNDGDAFDGALVGRLLAQFQLLGSVNRTHCQEYYSQSYLNPGRIGRRQVYPFQG